MARPGLGKNRRRHHRFEFPLNIEWARMDPTTGARGAIRDAAVVDVSAGGVAFMSDEPLPIGAPLLIDLCQPGAHHDRPRTRAAVTTCLALAPRRYRVGLRFLRPVAGDAPPAGAQALTPGVRDRSSALDLVAKHLNGLERERVHRAQKALRRTK